MKTVEERVYDFIKAEVDRVTETEPTPESPLFDIQVHDHVYRKIDKKKDAGVRIGTASGELSPNEGGTEFNEYNCELLLVVFVKIASTQKDGDERTLAMRKATDIAHALALLFWDNASCDAHFRDTRLRDFIRGYDSKDGDQFAIVNLTLRVTEIGGSIGR